ncbi:unnamed protein product [Diabrotica balteata]|uniref:Uncharacterized protein n=1 Tax=Diabrotica balteata TaxID=107213 RepID=A0A9P0GZ15_DIABA|nr:unnamed protein product [Diabrotica balteata]
MDYPRRSRLFVLWMCSGCFLLLRCRRQLWIVATMVFFVILTVCTTQVYTAALLGRCWVIAEEIHPSIKTKNRYPYAALAEVTFGKKLASTVTFLLDLTVFGAGIPNLIVVTSVFLLVCGCILFDANESTPQPAQIDSTFPWKTILKAYGILAFQFDIHPSILTIQVDMNDKSQLSKAIVGGFSTTNYWKNIGIQKNFYMYCKYMTKVFDCVRLEDEL